MSKTLKTKNLLLFSIIDPDQLRRVIHLEDAKRVVSASCCWVPGAPVGKTAPTKTFGLSAGMEQCCLDSAWGMGFRTMAPRGASGLR